MESCYTKSSGVAAMSMQRPPLCYYCRGQFGRARCSVCRGPWYCGEECQAEHWPLHRRDCVPPPPLLWVSPPEQQQRPLETPKKVLESPVQKQITMASKEQKKASESPSKEQDMMVSMNQVLPPTKVESGNGSSPLMAITKADHQKVQDFVEAKGDGGSKL